MPKHGKKFQTAKDGVEQRLYGLDEALQAVRTASFAKFDETLELSMRLGVNPRAESRRSRRHRPQATRLLEPRASTICRTPAHWSRNQFRDVCVVR